jgi:dUTP pyrophosphatase
MNLLYTSTKSELPSHAIEGDVGIDLTAISLFKKIGSNTFMFETDIAIQPPVGYYTEIVPRSSIIKTGYMLSNSIGVIDSGFRGSVKIVLTKVDPTMPDLVPPFTVCQLILRKAYTINTIRVESLPETERGSNGFGSTSK